MPFDDAKLARMHDDLEQAEAAVQRSIGSDDHAGHVARRDHIAACLQEELIRGRYPRT